MRTARHTMLDPLALLSGVTPAEDTEVVVASHPTEPAPSGADPAANQRLELAGLTGSMWSSRRVLVGVNALRAAPVTRPKSLVDPAPQPS